LPVRVRTLFVATCQLEVFASPAPTSLVHLYTTYLICILFYSVAAELLAEGFRIRECVRDLGDERGCSERMRLYEAECGVQGSKVVSCRLFVRGGLSGCKHAAYH
jgi:hypothetical protein